MAPQASCERPEFDAQWNSGGQHRFNFCYMLSNPALKLPLGGSSGSLAPILST